MTKTVKKHDEVDYGVLDGFHISEEEARIVGPVIDDFKHKHGRMPSGHELMGVARSKKCPAHRIIFDRPMKDAAEDYYLRRAQYFVRGIAVTYVPSTTKLPRIDGPVKIPAVTHRQVYSFPDGKGGRVHVDGREVARDPEWRKRVLDSFEGRIQAIRREARGFVSICDALDNVLDVIKVEQQRLRLDPPHKKDKKGPARPRTHARPKKKAAARGKSTRASKRNGR